MKKQFDFYEYSNPPAWNNELMKYGFPHIYQSSAFAENYPNIVGGCRYYPKYLYISDTGVIIGQCLIGISKRKTAQWFFGPVVKDSHLNFYNDIVTQMLEYLQKQGVLAVDFASTQIFYDKKIYSENDPLYSCICETCFVDLEQNLDAINSSFDSSVRKNVRKCNKEGVTVEITNDYSMIQLYLEMLSSFRKSRGFPLPPFHPNFMSMKLFSREHTSMDIAFASVNGKPIAAMGYVNFGKIVTEIAVAESEEFFRLKLPVNDLIKVKAIETYKLRGMKYYDITGGKKYTEDPKEQNINKFKRKFGKRLAEFQRIEHQYIQADLFIHKVNVNVLKAKQMFDKFLHLPSKVKRKVGQYYL